jgi:hypothetical protein
MEFVDVNSCPNTYYLYVYPIQYVAILTLAAPQFCCP